MSIVISTPFLISTVVGCILNLILPSDDEDHKVVSEPGTPDEVAVLAHGGGVSSLEKTYSRDDKINLEP